MNTRNWLTCNQRSPRRQLGIKMEERLLNIQLTFTFRENSSLCERHAQIDFPRFILLQSSRRTRTKGNGIIFFLNEEHNWVEKASAPLWFPLTCSWWVTGSEFWKGFPDRYEVLHEQGGCHRPSPVGSFFAQRINQLTLSSVHFYIRKTSWWSEEICHSPCRVDTHTHTHKDTQTNSR